MLRHGVVELVVLCVPALAWGQAPSKAPEALLSADTLVFFRFDGIEAHRQAYEKTAFAEVMRGELGKLLEYAATVIRDTVGPALLKENLLQGIPPTQLLKIQSAANQLPTALSLLWRQGFVVAFEMASLDPPRMQLTLIFPDAKDEKDREAVVGLFRLAAGLAGATVKESQLEGRTVSQIETKIDDLPLRFAWWVEGHHVVLTMGTEKPESLVELAAGKRPNLTSAPLFQSTAGFKRYETVARGFVDLERAVKMARSTAKEGTQIADGLGLEGLKSLVLHFGFEGRYDRSTIVLNLSKERLGDRKGLLRLAAAPENFELSALPPFPPDATSVTAMHLDLGALYDVVRDAVVVVADAVVPEESKQLKDAIQLIEGGLGINWRKDLLGSLGSTLVFYNAPSEGPFSLGTAALVKVKDAKKLQETIDALVKRIASETKTDVSLRRRTYRGVEMYTLQVAEEGFAFMPTYAIHNDWLVLGFYPQVVQGYVLRASGKYGQWKPPPLLEEMLAAAKKSGAKVTSISVADPRPTINQLFSVAPLIASLVNSFAPNSFDVFMLPNSQSITEHLFPNVTISVDEGTSLRMESYASLSLPFELTGLDTYAIALFFSFAVIRGF